MKQKRDQPRQVAALPVRVGPGGRREVLLVTSRETHRWIVPKGWTMRGKPDHEAAAVEAREEAGLVGRITEAPVGTYLYWKRRLAHFDLVEVQVYRLDVDKQLKRWREQGQRELRWFPPEQAAELVQEPGLAELIRAVGAEAADRAAS